MEASKRGIVIQLQNKVVRHEETQSLIYGWRVHRTGKCSWGMFLQGARYLIVEDPVFITGSVPSTAPASFQALCTDWFQ